MCIYNPPCIYNAVFEKYFEPYNVYDPIMVINPSQTIQYIFSSKIILFHGVCTFTYGGMHGVCTFTYGTHDLCTPPQGDFLS